MHASWMGANLSSHQWAHNTGKETEQARVKDKVNCRIGGCLKSFSQLLTNAPYS